MINILSNLSINDIFYILRITMETNNIGDLTSISEGNVLSFANSIEDLPKAKQVCRIKILHIP